MSVSKTAMRILLDTNIWLDFYFAARPAHREAEELYSIAKSKGVDLMYAAAAVKDIYFILGLSLKRRLRSDGGSLTEKDALAVRAVTWAAVEHLSQEAFAVGTDESDVWLACKYRRVHDDFEDDLLIAAAQRSQADYLVTNDEQHIRHSPVPTLSSRDALEVLRMLR